MISSKIDEFGDVYFEKDIVLKLTCISYDKENLKNIESDILEVINDKAFDGIAQFEVKEWLIKIWHTEWQLYGLFGRYKRSWI